MPPTLPRNLIHPGPRWPSVSRFSTHPTFLCSHRPKRSKNPSRCSIPVRRFHSDWQVLEEKVGANYKNHYVWSPAYVDALVSRDRDTDANGPLDERLFAQHDANFNVTAITNTSGTVQERYTPDPFGVVSFRNASGGTISAKDWVFLHQGGKADTLGHFDFRNRILSPTLGQWLTNDPLGFEAVDNNFYGYVNNYHISTVEPSGLIPGAIGGCVVASITGLITSWWDVDSTCQALRKLGLNYLIGLVAGAIAPIFPGSGTCVISIINGFFGVAYNSFFGPHGNQNWDCALFTGLLQGLIGCVGGLKGSTEEREWVENQVAQAVSQIIEYNITSVCEAFSPPNAGGVGPFPGCGENQIGQLPQPIPIVIGVA